MHTAYFSNKIEFRPEDRYKNESLQIVFEDEQIVNCIQLNEATPPWPADLNPFLSGCMIKNYQVRYENCVHNHGPTANRQLPLEENKVY